MLGVFSLFSISNCLNQLFSLSHNTTTSQTHQSFCSQTKHVEIFLWFVQKQTSFCFVVPQSFWVWTDFWSVIKANHNQCFCPTSHCFFQTRKTTKSCHTFSPQKLDRISQPEKPKMLITEHWNCLSLNWDCVRKLTDVRKLDVILQFFNNTWSITILQQQFQSWTELQPHQISISCLFPTQSLVM